MQHLDRRYRQKQRQRRSEEKQCSISRQYPRQYQISADSTQTDAYRLQRRLLMDWPWRRTHGIQSDQHNKKACTVQKEVARIAQGCYSDARQSRPNGRSAIKDHGLQAQGIANVLLWNKSGHKCSPRGLIKAQEGAVQK